MFPRLIVVVLWAICVAHDGATHLARAQSGRPPAAGKEKSSPPVPALPRASSSDDDCRNDPNAGCKGQLPEGVAMCDGFDPPNCPKGCKVDRNNHICVSE